MHTRNLLRDPRASLLFVADANSTAESAAVTRLTLTGRVFVQDNPDLRRLFLSRHPNAAHYAEFADFGFYLFDIAAGHLVAGFGRIAKLSRQDLLDRDG